MLKSLGLGGDGDESDAIENVEREFGVCLDPTDAPNWSTVGDVYLSLLKVMPSHAKDDPSVWKRFCAAICRGSGADGTFVGERTQILAPTLIEELKGWLKRDRDK
jgi:hypothetical protein